MDTLERFAEAKLAALAERQLRRTVHVDRAVRAGRGEAQRPPR